MQLGGRQVDFQPPVEVYSKVKGRNCKRALLAPLISSIFHRLRVVLRQAVAAKEARRIPYCFDGLLNGWSEDAVIRRGTYSLRHLPGGAAMMSGALWTRLLAHMANLSQDTVCVRCGIETETVTHRLWRCPCNQPLLDWLGAELNMPTFDWRTLPACFKRCGIPTVGPGDGRPSGIRYTEISGHG